MWVDQNIPNTDPSLGTFNNFTTTRVVYYEPPDQTVARAQRLAMQAEYFVGIYIPVAIAPPPSPPGYFLAQNSPNPFGDRTEIRFGAPGGSSPELRVYDAAGRLVRTFQPVLSVAGEGVVEWDGRDSRGNRLPSGLYFARLSEGHTSLSRKIIFLK